MSWKLHRLLAAGCAIAVTIAASLSQAAPITVIQENFERTDWSVPVGTAPNVVNLPGGQWTKTAGYSTFNPQIAYAAWGGTATKSLIMGTGGTNSSGNTNVGLAAAMTGYAPTSISASVKMDWTSNTTYGSFALGFYNATLPAASNGGVGVLVGFTGIAVSRNGTLTIYENGVAGSSVASGLSMSWNERSLSYVINPGTGSISNILWAGSAVAGLSSSAFTSTATKYAALVAFNSGGYSQTLADNFTVMGVAVPEPVSVALLSLAGLLLIGRRDRM